MQKREPEGFFNISEAAEKLSVSSNKLRRMLDEKYLLVHMRDGKALIPTEFLQGSRPLPSLRGTIILLSDLGLSDNEIYEWLYTENIELQEAPIDVLLKGHKAPVRRVAQFAADI